MMNTSEQLCLKWNDFQNNINTTIKALREDTDFADVTLVCEDGEQIEAHKVVLAASSPFFQNLFKRNKHAHPLVYMRGMKSKDLEAMVDFLYHGEVNIYQDNLDTFLAIGNELKLKGLNECSDNSETHDKVANKPRPKHIKIEQQTTVSNNTSEEKTSEIEEETSDIVPFEDKFPQNSSILSQNETLKIETFPNITLQELDEKVRNMYSTKKVDNISVHFCLLCGKENKYPTNIRDHIETRHTEGVLLPCDLCKKTFRSGLALRMH